MATSWPTTDPVTSTTLSRTHFDGGGSSAQAVTTGRIDVLVDRDEVLIQRPFSIYSTASTTTASDWTTVKTQTFILTPAHAGKNLKLTMYAYNSSAGTMEWRAQMGSSTSASSGSVTSTSSTNESTVTLTLPAMSTIGDQETASLVFQVKRVSGSGNATLAGPDHSLCYVED